jgi:hypothetical protein
MLMRLPLVVLSLLGSFIVFPVSVASADPKHGEVPRSECATVFEQFARIQPPADSKALSHALKDIRWISRAVVYQQTILAGWIPISHGLGPPGGVYVMDLSRPVSRHNAGYRIYFHTTRAFPGHVATDVRAFLAGRTPRDIRIDEYALCYPNGRFLLVDVKSRRMTPALF